jgi:tRNA (cmo5U34)-methyltransferase
VSSALAASNIYAISLASLFARSVRPASRANRRKDVVNESQGPFSNPAMVGNYADETPRKVPGLADLHRMAMLLLSERAQQAAHILVVGAGGGMELKAMAEAQPEWLFTGVDPSAAMLDLARRHVGPFTDRIALIEGIIDAAPSGPYDGAACLLTLHFLDRAERLRTLKEIHRRLKPGAHLVVAHHSVPSGGAERWLARSAAFADHTGVDWDKAMASATEMARRLPLLSGAEEEALLCEAGFSDVELFYAAFSFRGWVATASPA